MRELDYSCNCTCTNSWFEVTGPKKPLWNEYQRLWVSKWKIDVAISKFERGQNVAIVYNAEYSNGTKKKSCYIKIDENFIIGIDEGVIELKEVELNDSEKYKYTETVYTIDPIHENVINYTEFFDWQKRLKFICSQPDCPCCP